LESESYQALQPILAAADQSLSSSFQIASLCIIILLLIISAIFSGSEFAYFSLTPDQKKTLEGMHVKRSDMVLRLLVNPEKLIATHIVTNFILSVFIISLSAILLNQYSLFSLDKFTGILLQILIISLIILLVGKVIPNFFWCDFFDQFNWIFSKG